MRRNRLKYKVYAVLCMVLVVFGADAFAADPLTPPLPLELWGLKFKQATVVYSAVAAFLIFVACFVWSRGISKENPTKAQMLLEKIIAAFDELVESGFGTKRRGRIYLPALATLFLFIWTSNMMGLIPTPAFHIGGEEFTDYNSNGLYNPGEPFVDSNGNGVHDTGFYVPEPEEPTSNVSATLALAFLFVLILGHGSSIKYNGIRGYIADYFSPGGFIGYAMFPLNFVGKIAEVVSISFRLFGNIFGGAVIISVVSGLVYYVVLPPFLYGYFSVFVGTVQAFVYTMLALTYISSGAAEDPEAELEALNS